jgi:putative ABC transport system permease protein
MMALRQIRHAPGISIAAIITLAVGIGATSAVLSFVIGVMSASAPAPDMERLVALWSHKRGEAETKGLVSPADYLEWQSRARSFAVLAAWRTTAFNVSGAATPVRAAAQLVTPNYFDLFGWPADWSRVRPGRCGARSLPCGGAVACVLADQARRGPGHPE